MMTNRDKGGRVLKGKKWRVFNFVVEVAVESPKSVDEDEAAEDAAEFMSSMGRSSGRVHESFCHVVRIDEYGYKRPPGASVHNNNIPVIPEPGDGGYATNNQPKPKPKLKKVKPQKAKPKARRY
jgi:hypothetical protein